MHRSRLGVATGLSSVAFSLFVFLLIWGLGWGPNEATAPVLVMGSVYAVAAAYLLVRTAWASLDIEPASDEGTAGRRDS